MHQRVRQCRSPWRADTAPTAAGVFWNIQQTVSRSVSCGRSVTIRENEGNQRWVFLGRVTAGKRRTERSRWIRVKLAAQPSSQRGGCSCNLMWAGLRVEADVFSQHVTGTRQEQKSTVPTRASWLDARFCCIIQHRWTNKVDETRCAQDKIYTTHSLELSMFWSERKGFYPEVYDSVTGSDVRQSEWKQAKPEFQVTSAQSVQWFGCFVARSNRV